MIDRIALKEMSKDQLKEKWVLTGALFLCITAVIFFLEYIPLLGSTIMLIITGPIALSMVIISLKVTRNDKPMMEDTWSGFLNFGRAIGLYYWQLLWIFLWSLLFIIPGIIKAISYSMAFYILADNPNMDVREALNESKRITDGYKWDLFVLNLSFIGWVILAILSMGIGFFWLTPYMEVTYANTYKELAGKTY